MPDASCHHIPTQLYVYMYARPRLQMPTLPRASLASLVCPSAPFLAPRLLRAPLRALPSQCLLLPTAARRSKSDGKSFRRLQLSQQRAQKQQAFAAHHAVLQQMRQACADRNLDAFMELYPSVVATRAVDRIETRKIAQMLHYCMRSSASAGLARSDVLPFIQQVIQDIQKGKLPPHPAAFVHFLGIYKERRMYEDGHALWQWLAQQDDQHLSQAVYGAAIELLAQGRQLRLPELENLYLDALQRFPGTFAQYHLSPGAIVPNRSQPTVIASLPITLLQGILTARILYNDWKNAYLALDTALRLYPAQLPSRFFDLFVLNRPLEEAYTVFLVACRAGVVLSPSHLTGLVAKIKKAMEDRDNLRDRVVLLRASANAMYAYLEAGGSMEPIITASFLTSFGSLLPDPTSGKDYEGDVASLRNRIVTFAHKCLSSLFQAGMTPSPNSFTALIHLAGRLRVPDLLRVSLQDIRTAQVDIGDVGLRTVLVSASQIGVKDLIEETWTRIAQNADAQGKQIDWRDWATLAKACRRAQHLEYFHTQLVEFEHAIHPQHREMIVGMMDNEPRPSGKPLRDFNVHDFDKHLAELDQQMKNITAIVMSGQRLDIRQTPFYMSLDPEKKPLASVDDLRKVYDEYTVDPHQPPADNPPAVLSSIGIPLDELRFANWASILELMDQANTLEENRLGALERTGSKNRHDTASNLLHSDTTSALSIDRLREKIKILRETPVGQIKIQQNALNRLNGNRITRHVSTIRDTLETHRFSAR